MRVGGPVAGIGDKMSLTVSGGFCGSPPFFACAATEADVPSGRMISLPGVGSTFVSTAGELDGERPPLMLLHALACTAGLTWFTAFPDLAEHHPVAMFDQRWHGRGIRAGRRFRIEDLADDAVAVADVLGIERFVPVGYSLGGAVAQLVWKRHPDRVTGWCWRRRREAIAARGGIGVLQGASAAALAARADVTPTLHAPHWTRAC